MATYPLQNADSLIVVALGTTASTTTSTSLWHDLVAATRWGCYQERTCMRCFEGRVCDVQRGQWVACERCSGSGRVMVYLYPKLKRRQR